MNIPLFFVSREENTSEGIPVGGLPVYSGINYSGVHLFLSLKWQRMAF
jgi:hypothetical protein